MFPDRMRQVSAYEWATAGSCDGYVGTGVTTAQNLRVLPCARAGGRCPMRPAGYTTPPVAGGTGGAALPAAVRCGNGRSGRCSIVGGCHLRMQRRALSRTSGWSPGSRNWTARSELRWVPAWRPINPDAGGVTRRSSYRVDDGPESAGGDRSPRSGRGAARSWPRAPCAGTHKRDPPRPALHVYLYHSRRECSKRHATEDSKTPKATETRAPISRG